MSFDADGATLINAGLQQASFESSAAGWRPVNLTGDVNLAQYNNAAFAHDGSGFLETKTSLPGGSVAQNVSVSTQAGQSYSFSVWLRSAGASPVSGTLAVWGLGGIGQSGSTNFTVGPTWTRVTAPLPIKNSGHTILRAEIYMETTGLSLDADGAYLTTSPTAAPVTAPAPVPAPKSRAGTQTNRHNHTSILMDLVRR